MVSEELILKEYRLLSHLYPKLTPPEKEGALWNISGVYDLFDYEGNFVESFDIKITLPEDYPIKLPRITETSNKIPDHPDWHNSESGCCLSPDAIIYYRLKKIDLVRWFKTFVESFFANFHYKRNFGSYPTGEFSHFTKGIFEAYKNILILSTEAEVIEYLRNLLHPKKQNRNAPCFCGSQRKFKDCWLKESPYHQNDLNIPRSQLEIDLHEMEKELKGSDSKKAN
jgi:hypothetical protein